MSTPTQRVGHGNKKEQDNGSNPADNGEGSSTPRSSRIISSAAQTARDIWQSRTVASAVRPSEGTQAVAAQPTVQDTITTPKIAPSTTVQPTTDYQGNSSSQGRDSRVEELEALLRRFYASVTVCVRTSAGSQPAWNREATRENPVGLRLPIDGAPIEEIVVDVVLRERAPEELISSVVGERNQEVEASVGGTQKIQEPQDNEVDELIVPLRISRPYQMSFNQDQRRRQAEANASQGTTVASSSQNPTAEAPPTCTICYEPFTTRSTLMPCGHEFDLDCILPWFRSMLVETPFAPYLTCPLCRQRAQFIRHNYTPQGRFQLINIESRFRGPGHPLPRPWPMPHATNIPHPGANGNFHFNFPPGPVFRGPQPEDFRRRPAADIFPGTDREDYLDFDVIDRMAPFELENFISDIRSLSPRPFTRLSPDDVWRLAQRRMAFRNAAERNSGTSGLGYTVHL